MLEIMSVFNAIKEVFFLVGYVTNYSLFPEPLSPTNKIFSPFLIVKLTKLRIFLLPYL